MINTTRNWESLICKGQERLPLSRDLWASMWVGGSSYEFWVWRGEWEKSLLNSGKTCARTLKWGVRRKLHCLKQWRPSDHQDLGDKGRVTDFLPRGRGNHWEVVSRIRFVFLERSLWLLYWEPPRGATRLATAIVLVRGDDTSWRWGEAMRGKWTTVERNGWKQVDYW